MQSYFKRTAWTLAAAVMAVAFVASSTLVLAQSKTVKDAVYSEAQAKRGEALYKEQCASCHSADLSGGGAPALAGADFLGFWDKTPVADLTVKIKDSMPASSPGSLNAQQSTDITAYMLHVNKFPAGATELPSDLEAQKTITIVK